MNVKKLTPVLFVSAIEPLLPLWIDRLGFSKTVEVPAGDRLGFVILQKGNVELMYQTFQSVEEDLPAVSAAIRKGPTFLYIEVENLDAVMKSVAGAPVYMPVRKTFYGATEFGIQDPAGHFLTFAELAPAPGS